VSTRILCRTVVLLTTTVAAACSDSSTVAIPIRTPAFNAAASITPTTSVRWNEIARTLVASHNTNGPLASRAYALVSMAQFATVAAVDDADRAHGPSAAGGVKHPSVQAAIARASSNVLSKLYTDAATIDFLAAKLADDEIAPTEPQEKHIDVPSGDAIGSAIADLVLAQATADGASAANCPATPPTPASQFWHDDAVPPNPQPQLPCFGNVRPWLDLDVTQFRANPPAPPPFGSPAFLAGLEEVRHISDTRTAEQLATIDKWLDGNNTFTPPGHWNLIASELITRHQLNETAAARLLAVLNVAMMDTHIACWDRKYTYWELRPWMADPLITTPRGQPHHPANPSGHACAGGAGSGVVAGLFPGERDSLLALGDEAGFTTVLSGVHFRFDVDDGLGIGRAIAARALALRDDQLLALLR
jgi:membrane-associated phospholipid phosphatase